MTQADNGSSWNPWKGTLPLGSLDKDFSQDILIRGTADYSELGSLTSTAVVESTTPDPNTANNSASIIIPLYTTTDLVISINTDQSSIKTGEILVYTINITNQGFNHAQNVVLSSDMDDLLYNIEYSYDKITWKNWNDSLTLGTIESSASKTIYIRGTTNKEATGAIHHTIIVSSTTTDINMDNNSASIITPVYNLADLMIQKKVDAEFTAIGETLQYTILITNQGPNTAQSTILYDDIPKLLTKTVYSVDSGNNWNPWSGSLSLETLKPDNTKEILIRGIVKQGATGMITSTAAVSSITPDPNTSNNSSTIITPVHNTADLSIQEYTDKTAIQAGDWLTYHITITNQGIDDANHVLLEDILSDSLTDTEYSINNGINWHIWTGSLPLGTIENKASINILIRGKVKLTATGIITHTSTVSSTTPDPNSSNNCSTVIVYLPSVTQLADLSVTQQVNQDPITAGDLLTYILIVTNHGPDTAEDVLLQDKLPALMTDVVYSADCGVSWNTFDGSLSLGTLEEGTSEKILLRGRADLTATGRITNTATISSSVYDPNTANNNSTTIIGVTSLIPSTDLAITNKVNRTLAKAGGILTYTLTIKNQGFEDAKDVQIKDEIPSSLTEVVYSQDGGLNWQPWHGELFLETLQKGAIKNILIRGTIDSKAASMITTTASIKSSTHDPYLQNNSSVITTDLTSTTTDLSIEESVSPEIVTPDSIVTYTIIIRNNGTIEAEDVVMKATFDNDIGFVRFSTDNGYTWYAWNGSLNLGTMPANFSRTIVMKGMISDNATLELNNEVEVSSSTADSNLSNNQVSKTIKLQRYCYYCGRPVF